MEAALCFARLAPYTVQLGTYIDHISKHRDSVYQVCSIKSGKCHIITRWMPHHNSLQPIYVRDWSDNNDKPSNSLCIPERDLGIYVATCVISRSTVGHKHSQISPPPAVQVCRS